MMSYADPKQNRKTLDQLTRDCSNLISSLSSIRVFVLYNNPIAELWRYMWLLSQKEVKIETPWYQMPPFIGLIEKLGLKIY